MARSDWRSTVRGVADMVAHRDMFLENPGSMVDDGEIIDAMGLDDGDGDGLSVAALRAAWFDRLVERFSGSTFTVHRHMTVPDFDAFVAGLEAGEGATGIHWSLDPEIESPSDEVEEVGLRMTAEVSAEAVDWPTTFQQNFSHPWEEEVTVTGPLRLVSVTNLDTGEAYDPQASGYAAFAP